MKKLLFLLLFAGLGVLMNGCAAVNRPAAPPDMGAVITVQSLPDEAKTYVIGAVLYRESDGVIYAQPRVVAKDGALAGAAMQKGSGADCTLFSDAFGPVHCQSGDGLRIFAQMRATDKPDMVELKFLALRFDAAQPRGSLQVLDLPAVQISTRKSYMLLMRDGKAVLIAVDLDNPDTRRWSPQAPAGQISRGNI